MVRSNMHYMYFYIISLRLYVHQLCQLVDWLARGLQSHLQLLVVCLLSWYRFGMFYDLELSVCFLHIDWHCSEAMRRDITSFSCSFFHFVIVRSRLYVCSLSLLCFSLSRPLHAPHALVGLSDSFDLLFFLSLFSQLSSSSSSLFRNDKVGALLDP